MTAGTWMLLNGAGGGSGSFALQLAAAAGIRLTAVDNAGKLDLMRSLGAERVLDDRVDDFTGMGLMISSSISSRCWRNWKSVALAVVVRRFVGAAIGG